MEVTITGNLIEIVKDDGSGMGINGPKIVDAGAIRWGQYNSVPPASSGNPYLTPTPTKATRYKVVLHFNDNRWEEIYLGDVTNQAGWTDDLTGANTAVADLSAALVVSGGGGGGGVTSVSASAPLSSSGGATPTISISTSGATAGEALVYNGTTITWDTVTATPAGSDTQLQYNNAGAFGASRDLIFDGSLQIGAAHDVGQLQLGGATGTAVGTISSNGAMTVEGEDTTISGGNSVDVTTHGVSRLSIDANGAWAVNGSAGTADQYLKTNGAGAEPKWATINTDELTDNSTVGGGAQDLTTSLDDIANAISSIPAPPVTSVNGEVGAVVLTASDIDITPFVLVTIDGLFASEPFKFVATGQYQRVSDPLWTLVNNNGGFAGWLCSPDGGATPYESDSPKADPFTDIRSWTNPASAVVPGNVVGYAGPTVQDALEQVAQGVPILTGNTLWVDAVYGNDSTGLANRQDRPFLTLTAAKDAAVAGDLIEVRPGTYAIDPDTSLAKNGVNWYGCPGAILSKAGDPTIGIFDDGGGAIACVVSGSFELSYAPTGWGTSFVAPIKTTDPGSRITFSGVSIDCDLSVAEDHCAINGTDGTLIVNCPSITTTGFGYCLYWKNGDMFVTAERIIGDGNGAVTSLVTDVAMTGKYWVSSKEIRALSSDAIVCQSGIGAAPQQMWVNAQEVISDGASSSAVAFSGANIKLYVVSEKISSPGASAASIRNNASLANPFSGSVWITSQKVGSGQNWYADASSDSGSGKVIITCQEYEDAGDIVNGFDVRSSVLILDGGLATTIDGNCINIEGGSIRANGLDINTSSAASSSPVVVSGGVVILKNCTLVADATQDSITAPTAQTVVSYGSYANTAVDGNVTVDGLLTVGAYVS